MIKFIKKNQRKYVIIILLYSFFITNTVENVRATQVPIADIQITRGFLPSIIRSVVDRFTNWWNGRNRENHNIFTSVPDTTSETSEIEEEAEQSSSTTNELFYVDERAVLSYIWSGIRNIVDRIFNYFNIFRDNTINEESDVVDNKVTFNLSNLKQKEDEEEEFVEELNSPLVTNNNFIFGQNIIIFNFCR